MLTYICSWNVWPHLYAVRVVIDYIVMQDYTMSTVFDKNELLPDLLAIAMFSEDILGSRLSKKNSTTKILKFVRCSCAVETMQTIGRNLVLDREPDGETQFNFIEPPFLSHQVRLPSIVLLL